MSVNIKDLTEEMRGRFEERTNKTARVASLACLAAGITLLAAALSQSAHGGLTFVMGGICGLALAIYGGVKASFGCTILTDKQTGAVLETRDMYFPAGAKSEILSAMENERWDCIKKLAKEGCQQPLMLRAWYTKDGGFASAMLMEFVPYQYVPIGSAKELPAESRRSFIEAVRK